jgi:acyl dehydratase
MIDLDRLLGLAIPSVEQSYTARDTILYALAVGYGQNPLDERALNYCYEKALKATPTLPLVLAHPGFWMRDLDTGIDYTKVVHGEQSLTLHGPIPVEGKVVSHTKVVDVIDKGRDKGAIVVFDRMLYDVGDGAPIATMRQSNFCREEGGFGTTHRPPDPRLTIPNGPPHHVVEIASRPESALLYRLSADPNPLHVEPALARVAGFPRPILHGLASFGMVARALLESVCDYEAARLMSLSARFSGAFFPGESMKVELWKSGENFQFRATAIGRGVEVLRNGVAAIGSA